MLHQTFGTFHEEVRRFECLAIGDRIIDGLNLLRNLARRKKRRHIQSVRNALILREIEMVKHYNTTLGSTINLLSLCSSTCSYKILSQINRRSDRHSGHLHNSLQYKSTTDLLQKKEDLPL